MPETETSQGCEYVCMSKYVSFKEPELLDMVHIHFKIQKKKAFFIPSHQDMAKSEQLSYKLK